MMSRKVSREGVVAALAISVLAVLLLSLIASLVGIHLPLSGVLACAQMIVALLFAVMAGLFVNFSLKHVTNPKFVLRRMALDPLSNLAAAALIIGSCIALQMAFYNISKIRD